MNFFDEYKPFRNFMRKFSLVEGLQDLGVYAQHVMEGEVLPRNYAMTSGGRQAKVEHLFPWDFDVLSREIVLNGDITGSRSLKNLKDLAKATNYLRDLDNKSYKCGGPNVDIMFRLHHITQRQFPWQRESGIAPIMRAFKVFGEKEMEAVVVRELGLTMLHFIQLGLAVQGAFKREPGMSTIQDYRFLGISKDASDAFLRRLTCTTKELKAETISRQTYGENWLYTWNPLELKPLVSFDSRHPERVLCPVPRYLARRVAGGIFYDLVNAAGFQNPFGGAFQAYVGELIQKTCPSPRFTALPEQLYDVGRNKKLGADWILSDNTGHLFIEAKTKRLTMNSRTLGDLDALEKDLGVMAEAIVQHYSNIQDALDGKTRWVPDGQPVYPLILTLEDWFIVSPRVAEMLRSKVQQLLLKKSIPEQIIRDMPYTIASAHEFEATSQVIARVGIAELMGKKTTPEQWMWCLLPFVQGEFREHMPHVHGRLFAEDFESLKPKPPKV